jgi:tRNA G10  N-methylase Trm11
MRYFFVLGANPALSAAEIAAVVGLNDINVSETSDQVLVLEKDTLDTVALMRRLGGTIKIGRLIDDSVSASPAAVADVMYKHMSASPRSGRLTFGYSIYDLGGSTRRTAASLKNVGMEVKTRLKEEGLASRWVKSQEGPALTSVAVAKNKLIEEGAEFVVLATADRMSIGVTEAVQPFEEFSMHDYGRPSRDTIQGMLPPKLARMMLNLSAAQGSGRIADPFCGSGTVVTEALRLGYESVIGSDKNPGAIESTNTNVEWLRRHEPSIKGAAEVFVADARNLTGRLPVEGIAAMVTEPYLGPPRHGHETRGQLQKTLSELTKLYAEALSSWHRLLNNSAVVVMVLPIFVLGNEKHGLSGKELAGRRYIVEPLLPNDLSSKYSEQVTKNGGLIYGRPDQLVWREIIRLRKIEI